MAKIVSTRSATVDPNVEKLQTVLHEASLGGFGKIGDPNAPAPVAQLASTVDDLVDQVDALFKAMFIMLKDINIELVNTAFRLYQTEVDLDTMNVVYDRLTGSIEYDEALDHATSELMDCLAAGGGNVTADGKLVFDERMTFDKADLKPILRAALGRWIDMKKFS